MTRGTPHHAGPLLRYRRRLIRKRLLWRAFRKRRELSLISDRRDAIRPQMILGFATMRNETVRLPFYLDHYRRLGVGHFLIVDNGSTDGTAEFLRAQWDVSVWQTTASYRAARFGVDWLNWLLWRHAHGHWVLVADADEILIYPDWERRGLGDLTAWLDSQRLPAMGALMIDMYPKGRPDAQVYQRGHDPADILNWFDAHGYWAQRQPKLDTLWLQGGARARCFFADDPGRAPTLNKIPLVRWQRGFAFVNSTHSALPSFLNHTFDEGGREKPTGVLMHYKFLPGTAERAREEKARNEHFQVGAAYADYYDRLTEDPDLWHPGATRFEGWRQLLDLGLMSRGEWAPVDRARDPESRHSDLGADKPLLTLTD